MQNIKAVIQELLKPTGIKINGTRPFDIKIHNERFYTRLIRDGSMGLGESYMDGWWDCEDLHGFFIRILKADLEIKIRSSFKHLFYIINAKIFNRQTLKKSGVVGEQHYDLGNNLYELMLDKYMMYSCGYWRNANDLEHAQENKLDLICRKLELRPGLRVLEIGCGWGGFAQYAAENYGVSVVGVTISKEQAELASKRCSGLDVEIRLQDYRDLDEKFDRIVSIGMFEHVGHKNYKTYMEIASRCLTDNGIFLLHCIGGNESMTVTDPWIDKYIFPNGVIPSPVQVTQAFEGVFLLEDWHNFGLDYEKTLMAWLKNFKRSWPNLEEQYSQRFYRMWEYYINVCAASFNTRKNNLWQIILTKPNNNNVYLSIR